MPVQFVRNTMKHVAVANVGTSIYAALQVVGATTQRLIAPKQQVKEVLPTNDQQQPVTPQFPCWLRCHLCPLSLLGCLPPCTVSAADRCTNQLSSLAKDAAHCSSIAIAVSSASHLVAFMKCDSKQHSSCSQHNSQWKKLIQGQPQSAQISPSGNQTAHCAIAGPATHPLISNN